MMFVAATIVHRIALWLFIAFWGNLPRRHRIANFSSLGSLGSLGLFNIPGSFAPPKNGSLWRWSYTIELKNATPSGTGAKAKKHVVKVWWPTAGASCPSCQGEIDHKMWCVLSVLSSWTAECFQIPSGQTYWGVKSQSFISIMSCGRVHSCWSCKNPVSYSWIPGVVWSPICLLAFPVACQQVI